MLIKLKIQNAADREKVVVGLFNAGYRVGQLKKNKMPTGIPAIYGDADYYVTVENAQEKIIVESEVE